MSDIKKSKKVAIKTDANPTEPKKRVPRVKKLPTKEEALKMLSDTSKELKQILDDVREDEMKLSCMQLKRVPELIKDTISNLEEDLKEIDEQSEEIKLLPDGSEVKLK